MSDIVRGVLNGLFSLLGTKLWLWWMDHGGSQNSAPHVNGDIVAGPRDPS